MRLKLLLAAVGFIGGLAAVSVPAVAEAQPRGHGHAVRAHPVVSYGAYYRPFWGYDSWYWYPYGFYAPYAYYPTLGQVVGSLRIEVEPKDAEVFVDGYYAGLVDDFDGFFQRLEVAPGEHEITLYKEGYRRVVERLYLRPGTTYRLRHTMEPLAPGEAAEPRPQPRQAAPPPTPSPALAQGPSTDVPPAPAPITSIDTTGFGELAIRVQPEGAQVLIDGESWQSPEGVDRLVVHLPAGAHRVEVRKEGHATFTAEVQVTPGETAVVNVSLRDEP